MTEISSSQKVKKDKLYFIDIITSHFKDIKIIKYSYAEGYNSRVFVINDSMVFKFPLNENNGERMVLREVGIINKISSHISTIIPNMSIIRHENEVFSYHSFIKGIVYDDLTENQKILIRDSLAIDLAIFIHEMHSIKCDFLKIGKSLIDGFAIRENFSLIQEYLKDRIRINDFQKSFKVVEEFDVLKKDYVLCHNDLNSKNIVIDLEKKCLSGIIDFGNSRMENYNVEFSIMVKEDIVLMKKIIKEYEKLTKRKINFEFILSYEKLRSYASIGLLLSQGKEVDKKINDDLKVLSFFDEKYIN